MSLSQRRYSLESILDRYARGADYDADERESLPSYESLIHPAFRGQLGHVDEKLMPAPLRVRTSGPGFPPPRTVDLPIQLEHELPQVPSQSVALRNAPTSHPVQRMPLDDAAVPTHRRTSSRPLAILERTSRDSLDSYKTSATADDLDDTWDVVSNYRSNTFSASSSRTSINTERSHKLAHLQQDFSQPQTMRASAKAMSVLGIIPQSHSHSRNSSTHSTSVSSNSSSSPGLTISQNQPKSQTFDKTKASHRGRTVYVGCEKALLVLGITEDGEPRPSTPAGAQLAVADYSSTSSASPPSKTSIFSRRAKRESKTVRPAP